MLGYFFKKSNCDVCKKEVRKSKLVTLNNINFCCYNCYDEYLRTLSKEEWYKFFGINIGNSN